ncbi:heme-containing dehydratase protein [Mariannaea sp. PMI_226]|nr:heme-containing dehydratase protein [Mariannaea sp. PMI_226]
MLRVKFPTAHHFTVALFGCQYHAESPSQGKLELINTFQSLLKSAAIGVEELEQNDQLSKLWLSYWESPQTFKAWWESADIASFWSSLPDDAGFWRETISLPATRAIYQTNKGDPPAGFAHCGELIPLTSKSGYWGAYRSRMTPESPDDKFESPLPSLPEPRPSTGTIRHGRVKMTKFPDNICYVVEGQDYSAMAEKERDYWNENLDGLAKQWITTVVRAGHERGLISARACHPSGGEKLPEVKSNGAHDASSSPSDAIPGTLLPGLNYASQTQILFWLDLAKMEYIGRTDKVHVKLRRDFFTAYTGGGAMEGGDLWLWVDLGILKGDEIDAEYIGCYDDTGFMAYDDHPLFASETGSPAKLPDFFEKPIESNPMEW